MVGNVNMEYIDRQLREAVPREGGIGFVGADIPVELLLATGRPFGHLPWSDAATPRADRWLEPAFPFWTRAILEDWHAGRYDALSQVVFSRTDDASQRLYYYVRELRRRGMLRGPEPLVFDGALIPRESSLAHTAAAVRELASALGVNANALVEGVRRANRLRAKLASLEVARRNAGPFHERLARAVLFSDASRWIDGVALPSGPDRPRVMLAGSVPPDDRLHQAVEDAGASIVVELHAHALPRVAEALDPAGADVALALARRISASSLSPRSFTDRAAALITAASTAGVQAVILWLTREDEGLAWHVPAQRRALAAAGLPSLVLANRDWRVADGAPAEISRFIGETFA